MKWPYRRQKRRRILGNLTRLCFAKGNPSRARRRRRAAIRSLLQARLLSGDGAGPGYSACRMAMRGGSSISGDNLATYPYVTGLPACAHVVGDIDMRDLLEYLAADCKWWHPLHPYHKGCYRTRTRKTAARFATACSFVSSKESLVGGLSTDFVHRRIE